MKKAAITTALVAALVVGAIGTAAPAQAAQPDRFHLEPTTFELPVGFCSFPVEYVETQNTVVGTAFSDGRLVFTGGYKVRLTNELNGKSVSLNASGAGTFYPDLTNKFNGNTIFLFTSDRDEISGLWYTRGTWGTIDDPTGTYTISLYGSGTKTNMCDVIA